MGRIRDSASRLINWFRRGRRQEPEWLSEIVENEGGPSKKKAYTRPWLPGSLSLWCAAAALGSPLFGAIEAAARSLGCPWALALADWGPYTGVQAGLTSGGLTTLAVLVALTRDESPLRTRAAVIRSAWVLETVSFGLGALVTHLWDPSGLVPLVGAVLTGVLVIWALFRTVRFSLVPSEWEDATQRLFIERVSLRGRRSYYERCARERFRTEMRNRRMDVEALLPYWHPRHDLVSSRRSGLVADVNLRRLGQLVSRVRTATSRSQAPPVQFQELGAVGATVTPATTPAPRNVLLVPCVGAELQDGDPVLASEGGPETRDALAAQFPCPDPGLVDLMPTDRLEDVVGTDLSGLLAAVVRAIRRREVEDLDHLLRLYPRLVQASRPDQAPRRATPTEPGSEVEWARRHLHEIVLRGGESADVGVQRVAVRLPYLLLVQAASLPDASTFRAFADFARWVQDAVPGAAPALAKEVADLLGELGSTHLPAALVDTTKSDEEVEAAADCGACLIDSMADLIRRGLGPGAVWAEPALAALGETRRRFERERRALERPGDPGLHTVRQQAVERILAACTEDCFLAAAWLLRAPTEHVEHRQVLFAGLANMVPQRVSALGEVFERAWTGVQENMHTLWDRWEREEMPSGTTWTPDYGQLPTCFLLVLLNRSLGADDLRRAARQVGASRGVADLAAGPLRIALQGIREDPDTWRPFAEGALSPEALANLQEFLNEVGRTWADEEHSVLAKAVVDPVRIQAFTSDLTRAESGCANLRRMCSAFQGYLIGEHQEAPRGAGLVRRTVDAKAAFLPDWPVAHEGWGEAYGESLGQAKDTHSVRVLRSAMPPDAAEATDAQLAERLCDAAQQLRGARLTPNAVLLSRYPLGVGWEGRPPRLVPQFMEREPSDLASIPGYWGALACPGRTGLPVFIVLSFADEEEPGHFACVADFAAFVRWTQYDYEGSGAVALEGGGAIRVEVFDLGQDKERRQQILDQNPAWLEEHKDRDDWLRTRALVEVEDRFQFEILNPEAAGWVRLVKE